MSFFLSQTLSPGVGGGVGGAMSRGCCLVVVGGGCFVVLPLVLVLS